MSLAWGRHYPEGDYEPEEWEERVRRFANPGGNSALYAAGPDNPRDRPCPRCGVQDVLTPADVAAHYVCDRCADAAERGF